MEQLKAQSKGLMPFQWHITGNSDQRYIQVIHTLFNDSVLVMTITVLASASTAMIDGILTSRFLGSRAMTAYGIASVYYSITTLFRSFFMVGCTAVCTRAIGKHDTRKLHSVFSITIMLTVLISFIWLYLGISSTQGLAIIFGARENQIVMTSAYLKGVFLGSPAFMCYITLIYLIHIDGNKSIAKITNIILTIVDLIGDLIVVFLFQQNFISLTVAMFGMGLASAVSHIAALCVVLPHFFRRDCIFKFVLLPWLINI